METLKILLTLSIILSFPITPGAIPSGDLDSALMLLRASGRTLFANAISTSDLLFDLLSLPSLTLFAPTDPALFALDMTQTPPFYLSTLRLHALPIRLSWSDLRQLPNNSSLSTLFNSRDLLVTRGDFGSLLLGGVPVLMPGLYYSTAVAVHGLAGILTFRSPLNHTNATPPPPPPLIPTPPNHTLISPSLAIQPSSPIDRIPTPAPGPATLHGYTPAESPDGHDVLTGKPIKNMNSKHKNRAHSSTVNGTVSFHPVAKIPRTSSSNRRNHTDSFPFNSTNSSSPVNHIIVSPLTIPASSQIDGGIVVSSPAPEPAGLYGSSPAKSQEDRNVFVSPPVLTPAPGPAGVYGYSRDIFGGDSSGFLLESETSISPAPVMTDLISRKISEDFVDGEICVVG